MNVLFNVGGMMQQYFQRIDDAPINTTATRSIATVSVVHVNDYLPRPPHDSN